MVRKQIDVLCNNFPVAAIKTGLLYSGEVVTAVARAMLDLSDKLDQRLALVVDPVTIATSGATLLRAEAINLYKKELFPLATLLTPNLDEAGKLLRRSINDLAGMRKAGKELEKQYGVSILLKGGHLAGNSAIDLLFHEGKMTEFAEPFVHGVATHGTGCTYSAAITAGLATGLTLEDAIRRAKQFVTASIAQRFRWTSKSGSNLDALNHSAPAASA